MRNCRQYREWAPLLSLSYIKYIQLSLFSARRTKISCINLVWMHPGLSMEWNEKTKTSFFSLFWSYFNSEEHNVTSYWHYLAITLHLYHKYIWHASHFQFSLRTKAKLAAHKLINPVQIKLRAAKFALRTFKLFNRVTGRKTNCCSHYSYIFHLRRSFNSCDKVFL